MKTTLNVIWLLLSGVWLFLGYAFAALLLAVTVIGIPLAAQAWKLGVYSLWPFGRVVVDRVGSSAAVSMPLNILWFVLCGIWLAIGHFIGGALLCLTVIGIPLGVANFKLAGLALNPFGKEIVSMRDLRRERSNAASQIAFPG